jgi:hypothetical protein
MIIPPLRKKNMMPKSKKLKLFSIPLCKKYINKLEEPLAVYHQISQDSLEPEPQELEHQEPDLNPELKELLLELKMLNKQRLFKEMMNI